MTDSAAVPAEQAGTSSPHAGASPAPSGAPGTATSTEKDGAQVAHPGTLAGLFPGQGSQIPQMEESVRLLAPELLQMCTELVGEDPFPRVAESTRFAQPAIFCASVASLEAHRKDSEIAEPVVYAGHSLGELAALVAAGAVEKRDGLELAVLRGELMAAAAEQDRDGGMLALIGASEEVCAELAESHEVVLANDNAPGQAVLAGAVENLKALAAGARGRGLRAVMLDVAGAFHSPAMAAAVAPFKAALDKVTIKPPRMPVISCASAKPFVDIRAELADAIIKPVHWRSTMQALSRLGAGEFLDYGPGRVLARLVRRNIAGARAIESPLPACSPPESAGNAA